MAIFVIRGDIHVITGEEERIVGPYSTTIFPYRSGNPLQYGYMSGSGGPVIGGNALIEGRFGVEIEGEGGFVLGGTAPKSCIRINDGDVAFVANGVIAVNAGYDVGIVRDSVLFKYNYVTSASAIITGSGGFVLGGTSDMYSEGGNQAETIVGSGGFILGGSASIEIAMDLSGIGGFVLGGSAEVEAQQSMEIVGSGGFVLGGDSKMIGYQDIEQRVVFIL